MAFTSHSLPVDNIITFSIFYTKYVSACMHVFECVRLLVCLYICVCVCARGVYMYFCALVYFSLCPITLVI